MKDWHGLLEGEAANTLPHLVESFESGEFMVTIEPDVQDYDTRVLALPHAPECLTQLQAAHNARRAYITAHPGYCRQCNGTGEREAGSLSYEDPPDTDLCWHCIKQTICPQCGLTFAMKSDGSEPCRVCGFDFDGGIPERAFCTCGADSVLYEQESVSLPDFPE